MTTSFDNFPPDLKQAFIALAKSQAETSLEVKSAANSIKQLNKLYGSMAANKGDETEEFFYNTLLHEPVIGKLKFDKVIANMLVGTKGKETELDLMLVNGSSLAVIEVKNKCHVNDLDQLESQLKFLRKSSPEYKGLKFFGGIAGFSVPKDVVGAAHERGFFVLKRVGKVMSSNTTGMTAY